MLRFLGLSIVFLLIGGCKKELPLPATRPSCEEPYFQENWVTETLKSDYTIQFPGNYTGPGLTSFEGPLFLKTREDNNVQFSYAFCNGLYCTEFGAPLEEPSPSTIFSTDRSGQNVLLSVRTIYCRGEESESILFYNNNAIERTGKYYMKIGGKLVEALNIYYADASQGEISNILKTITKR